MRLATPADIDAAMVALVRTREKNPGRQMQYTDEATARAYMSARLAEDHVVVEQGYLILFDIGSPWYSKERFLIEDLIIRIAPTPEPVTVAIDALSVLAGFYGCVAVISGDTQIGLMAPHYIASGFVPLGSQFIKEVVHGIPS